MTDLPRALDTAIEAARVARKMLLAECARPDGPRGEIGHCPVDDEVELFLRQFLQDAFPTYGFLGEETGLWPAPARQAADGDKEHENACLWVVDPNDGTSSMQRGYRGHAVSIALLRAGVPVLGVVWAVDAPDDSGDLIAWAECCGPVQRNGDVVTTALRQELGPQDVVAVSQGANRNPLGNFPCTAPARFVGLPSIAYRLALVAAGECAATMSVNRTQAWDHAAGHALLRGAGGAVFDENGRELTYDSQGQSHSRWVFGGSESIVAQLLRRPWERASGSGFGQAVPPPSLAPARPSPTRLEQDSEVLRRAQGCLLGQIAGDALGALVEFSSAAEIAQRYPDGGPRQLADGGPHRIAAGQPTDDSELALMLARTLVANDDFSQEHVAAAYARWLHGWTHADQPASCEHSWCLPFDVGGTTSQALSPITAEDVQAGHAAAQAVAAANRQSQANGALMRISPIGVWGASRSTAEVAMAARLDAQLTHPHPVCQDASAVFAVALATAIGSKLTAHTLYEQTLDWARVQQLDHAVVRTLETAATSQPTDFLTQQGWVLIALQNAFYQLTHAATLEDGVVATVRAGGDSDTNAAICGALLGAVHGRPAIPFQWQQMVLTCRPMVGQAGVRQPRPAMYWPIDVLIIAERLLRARR